MEKMNIDLQQAIMEEALEYWINYNYMCSHDGFGEFYDYEEEWLDEDDD